MALCDYRQCDNCGEKAFYDANISDQRYLGAIDQSDYDEHWGAVQLRVLCPDCASTHELKIVERDKPISKNEVASIEQNYLGELYFKELK